MGFIKRAKDAIAEGFENAVLGKHPGEQLARETADELKKAADERKGDK